MAADLDQGFLVHMLLVRHNAARYALGGGAHRVDHFWGGKAKPWKRVHAYAGQARRRPGSSAPSLGLELDELCPYAAWLQRSLPRAGANESDGPRPTPCARLFAMARDSMHAELERWRKRWGAGRGAAFPQCLLTHCSRTAMHAAPEASVF